VSVERSPGSTVIIISPFILAGFLRLDLFVIEF
jgi:hypothetical protein